MAAGDKPKGKKGRTVSTKASKMSASGKKKSSRTTTGLVVRGRDEIDFLGSRAESTPLSAPTLRAHLQGIRTRIKSGMANRGREAHEVGTVLITVYMRHGDVVLDFKSYRQLLLVNWPDRLEDAYGYMMVAKWCTAEQAETHGYWKALYGIRLAQKLGLLDFDALEAKEFGVDEDGTPITFARMTIEAIRALSAPAAIESAQESEPSGRAVLRLRDRAQKLQSEKPEYAALKVKIFVSRGAPSVTVTSSRKEGAEAARRFLADLWK